MLVVARGAALAVVAVLAHSAALARRQAGAVAEVATRALELLSAHAVVPNRAQRLFVAHILVHIRRTRVVARRHVRRRARSRGTVLIDASALVFLSADAVVTARALSVAGGVPLSSSLAETAGRALELFSTHAVVAGGALRLSDAYDVVFAVGCLYCVVPVVYLLVSCVSHPHRFLFTANAVCGCCIAWILVHLCLCCCFVYS